MSVPRPRSLVHIRLFIPLILTIVPTLSTPLGNQIARLNLLSIDRCVHTRCLHFASSTGADFPIGRFPSISLAIWKLQVLVPASTARPSPRLHDDAQGRGDLNPNGEISGNLVATEVVTHDSQTNTYIRSL